MDRFQLISLNDFCELPRDDSTETPRTRWVLFRAAWRAHSGFIRNSGTGRKVPNSFDSASCPRVVSRPAYSLRRWARYIRTDGKHHPAIRTAADM
jgi:hypothetical protein